MNFGIAAYADGSESITALANLATPLPSPQHFYHDAESRVELLSGHDRWQGEPWTEWRFRILTVAQYAVLRAYNSGPSADVFISTPDADGTFDDYQAIMRWPDPGSSQIVFKAGYVYDVLALFYNMTAVPSA